MDTNRVRGIIPPMVTPFDSKEEINETVLQEEAAFLFKSGIHGISLGGSTGEGALLNDAELERGISIIQHENLNKVPVLCGIIRNSTRAAVSAGLAAKKAGADVLMVTPTFYHGTDARGNFEFYRELGKETGMPIVIYNVIGSNPITPDMMMEISEIEEVIGIKQSVGGIHALADMINMCGDKTMIYGAQDDVLYLSYAAGAVGAISAILTLFPKLCVEQWNAVQEGDIQRAKEINDRMLPVWRIVGCGMAFPGMIKTALRMTDRDVGYARRPILDPPEELQDKLRTALKQNGFI